MIDLLICIGIIIAFYSFMGWVNSHTTPEEELEDAFNSYPC